MPFYVQSIIDAPDSWITSASYRLSAKRLTTAVNWKYANQRLTTTTPTGDWRIDRYIPVFTPPLYTCTVVYYRYVLHGWSVTAPIDYGPRIVDEATIAAIDRHNTCSPGINRQSPPLGRDLHCVCSTRRDICGAAGRLRQILSSWNITRNGRSKVRLTVQLHVGFGLGFVAVTEARHHHLGYYKSQWLCFFTDFLTLPGLLSVTLYDNADNGKKKKRPIRLYSNSPANQIVTYFWTSPLHYRPFMQHKNTLKHNRVDYLLTSKTYLLTTWWNLSQYSFFWPAISWTS